MSAAPSPISKSIPAFCSGPASRSSTGTRRRAAEESGDRFSGVKPARRSDAAPPPGRGGGGARGVPEGAAAVAEVLTMAAEEGTTTGNLCIGNASIADLQQALAEGRTSASALTRAYLARIEAYDRAGPQLNAVREINPEALAIAVSLDPVKPSPSQPLAGIPILVKDNLATGDRQHTTAGSL